MRKPLRTLSLMIAGKADVPHYGDDVDDIIDCTPEGPEHDFREKVLHVPPSGTNAHNWAAEDLDTIVALAAGCLAKGRHVLIHCNRGVSRSTCAAAAVLLHLGLAKSVEQAVALARHPDREPVRTAVASLARWWASRGQLPLL